jgi:hypothetical protein
MIHTNVLRRTTRCLVNLSILQTPWTLRTLQTLWTLQTALAISALLLFAACSLSRAQKNDSALASASSTSAPSPGSVAEEPGATSLATTPSSAANEEPGDAGDTGQTKYGTDSPACRLFPIAEMEAHFGSKVKVKGGLDAGNNSTCTAEISGQSAQIQTAAPGTLGLPTTIPQGLQFATMVGKNTSKGDGLTIDETKDFGSIGCYKGKLTLDPAKPIHTTTCFQVAGGFLMLVLGSQDPNKVDYEAVKQFLSLAAARRK